MKKRSFTAAFIAAIFLILGCASKTKVTISVADSGSPLPVRKAVEYASYREAMKNVDLSYLEKHPVNDEQKRFAQALQLITEGKELEAIQVLQQLGISAIDTLLKRDLEEILSNLLFYRSSWKELLELHSRSQTAAHDSDLILPRAYSTSLPESYTFLSTSIRLPTTFTASAVPAIEIEVNGQKKKFLLDTGAGMSVVSTEVSQECHILPLVEQKAQAGTGTSRKIGIQPGIIGDLKIGNLYIKNHPVIIIDQKDLQFKLLGLFTITKIEGIIGWNAIQNLSVEIDYQQKITTVQRPEKIETLNRNFFSLGGYPIVRMKSEDGISLNFGLDTGARESWITDNLLKKMNQLNTTRRPKTIGSAGGREKVESRVLPELKLILGHHRIAFNNIGTRPTKLAEFVELDGVLGGDVFDGAKIRIDYTNRIFDLAVADLPR